MRVVNGVMFAALGASCRRLAMPPSGDGMDIIDPGPIDPVPIDPVLICIVHSCTWRTHIDEFFFLV